MGGIFSMDSKVIRLLNGIVELVFLNLVFLLTCIPIVTIGTAFTALYSVTLRMARKEDGYVIKSYFQAFAKNFKQSFTAWIIILAAIAVLGINQRICLAYAFTGKTVIMMLLVILSMIAGISVIFIFPIMARFEAPLKNMFLNSLCMPLSRPIVMITVVLIQVVPVVIALLSQAFFVVWVYMLIMGWFAIIAYISSLYLNKMFDCYSTPPKSE